MFRKGFDLLVTFGCLALIGYLAWHAAYGGRSFAQAERLAARIDALMVERDRLRAERQALDRRVALVRPDSVDPDMVEELARRDLAFARDGDIVVAVDR